MTLGEIKVQALRLMFADTDVNFTTTELGEQKNGVLYTNSNTSEKLTKMEASISRAIDMYYQYNKEQTKIWDSVPLHYTFVITDNTTNSTYTLQTGESLSRDTYGVHTVVDSNGAVVKSDISVVYTFYNYLSTTTVGNLKPTDFAFPTRVDLLRDKDYVNPIENITYYYDELTDLINFYDQDYAAYDSDTVKLALKFRVYYKVDIKNLDSFVNEQGQPNLTDASEINDINIPIEVQRMIPYFVKGELYEEDEPDLARAAKQEFIAFMAQRPRKLFTKVQTKVKSYKRSEE